MKQRFFLCPLKCYANVVRLLYLNSQLCLSNTNRQTRKCGIRNRPRPETRAQVLFSDHIQKMTGETRETLKEMRQETNPRVKPNKYSNTLSSIIKKEKANMSSTLAKNSNMIGNALFLLLFCYTVCYSSGFPKLPTLQLIVFEVNYYSPFSA